MAAKRRDTTQQIAALKKQNAILLMERNALSALVQQLNDVLELIQKDLVLMRSQFSWVAQELNQKQTTDPKGRGPR